MSGRLAHRNGHLPGHDSQLRASVYGIPPSGVNGGPARIPGAILSRGAARPREGSWVRCSLALGSPPVAGLIHPRGCVSETLCLDHRQDGGADQIQQRARLSRRHSPPCRFVEFGYFPLHGKIKFEHAHRKAILFAGQLPDRIEIVVRCGPDFFHDCTRHATSCGRQRSLMA